MENMVDVCKFIVLGNEMHDGVFLCMHANVMLFFTGNRLNLLVVSHSKT